MEKRIWATTGGTVRRAVFVLLFAMATTGCATESEQVPFRPVADVQELMAHMIDPAADAVWDAVGIVLTADGVDEWRPETDEDWAVVMNGAVTITESANLLMMGPRARDQDTWMRMAQGMVDAGLLAVEAAEARDADAIFALGEDIYNACDRCHNLYWVGDEDRGRVRSESTSLSEE